MSDLTPNGWGEWSRHVLMELKRLNESLETAVKEIRSNRTDITVLETQTQGKERMCKDHRDESKKALELAQKNSERIASHRLITAAISSATAILTALITALVTLNQVSSSG